MKTTAIENDDATVQGLFDESLAWAENCAKGFCRKFKVPGHAAEAIKQAATLGLWRAARRWRFEGGASFRTFASALVFGAMKDECRGGRGKGRDFIHEDIENAHVAVAENDSLERQLEAEGEVAKVLTVANARQRRIVGLLVEGRRVREIAEMEGVSPQRLGQLMKELGRLAIKTGVAMTATERKERAEMN